MSEAKKKPIGKIILIVVIVLVVVGAIGSMGGGSKGTSEASSASSATAPAQEEPKKQEPEQEPYTITDETLDTSNQFFVKITGTLTNNTDSDKSYIQVEYNLYDADGAQIGTALANTNNLKSGGTWKFEAMSTVEPANVAKWERTGVTGF